MKLLPALALLAAMAAPALAAPALARAESPSALLPEGAPLYLQVRPGALAVVLKQLGLGELSEVKQLRRQFGGVDPLDPRLLAATGLDVNAPVMVALLEPARSLREQRHRLVARMTNGALFTAFLRNLASSGQLDIETVGARTPAGKLGVLFTGRFPDLGTAVVRVAGDHMVLDVVRAQAKASLSAAEVARRYPLAPRRVFVPGGGARRLLQPEVAVGVYADARHLAALLEATESFDTAAHAGDAARASDAEKRASCRRQWSSAPTVFDDVALTLVTEAKATRLSVAWGTHGGQPLGGLVFRPSDDIAFNLGGFEQAAPLVAALFANPLESFQALPRAGIFTSADAFRRSLASCALWAWPTVLLRSWPLALAAAPISTSLSGDASLAARALERASSGLVVLGDRRTGEHWFAAITLDASLRELLDPLLPRARGAPLAVFGRSPMAFPGWAGNKHGWTAFERLPAGPLVLVRADSRESLLWGYRAAGGAARATGGGPDAGTKARSEPSIDAPPLPIARLRVDGRLLAEAAAQGQVGASGRAVLEGARAWERIDGDLTADGDLFRLTIRTTLKQ